jgi:hypothetical protein
MNQTAEKSVRNFKKSEKDVAGSEPFNINSCPSQKN